MEEYPVLNVGWVLTQEPSEVDAQAMLQVAPDTYRWIVAMGE